MFTVIQERRGEERRSPVGDFLLGALARSSDGTLQYAELLQIAGGSGLNMSSVLAWASRAEESGLIEQQITDEGRSLRLTEQGVEIARNDRRRGNRRELRPAPADDAT